MKSDRPSPPGPPVPYARHPPPEEHRPPPMIASHHPPTLPSIHHLHPELASTTSIQPPMASSSHGQASYFTSESIRDYGTFLSAFHAIIHLADLTVVFKATRHGTDNSDPEGDPPGPPKKKRRRQALSCTGVCPILLRRASCPQTRASSKSFLECKRRKIKCDR